MGIAGKTGNQPKREQKDLEKEIQEIFSAYSLCTDASMESRRETLLSKLLKLVFQWCTEYPFYFGRKRVDAGKMGLEIFETVQNCVKKYAGKTPEEFFPILEQSLKNAWAKYYSGNKKRKNPIKRSVAENLKKANKLLEAKTHEMGRALTLAEKQDCISGYFGIKDDTARKYLQLMDSPDVDSLAFMTADDEKNASIPYIPDISNDPADEYMQKIIKERLLFFPPIIESVIKRYHQKTWPCYRAIFTVYCIDNSIDFEGNPEFIDSEIMEAYKKTGKRPSLYEAYLKYHPVTKGSAEAMSSKMRKTLIADLGRVLKEKNPELFPEK